jgi:hypothetical protein
MAEPSPLKYDAVTGEAESKLPLRIVLPDTVSVYALIYFSY